MGYWNIEAITGYTPQTTFWEDFTIAEHFGNDAIKDTFNRAFDGWKKNCIYLTELVMVLNWKIWEWYDQDDARTMVYTELWEKADEYACNNLEGDELDYFYRTTD